MLFYMPFFKMQKNHGSQGGFRRRVSVVWKYFEKLSQQKVKCRLCGHIQNYQGTTGNIIRHLKSKHRIDATVKARREHDELDDSKIEAEFNVIVKNENTTAQAQVFDIHEVPQNDSVRRETYEEDVVDPYTEQFDEYAGYLNSNQEHNSRKENQSQSQSSYKNQDQTNLSAAEQRILAEIEYFREKKEYYRMQTNLTALQAKKIKCELEQLG